MAEMRERLESPLILIVPAMSPMPPQSLTLFSYLRSQIERAPGPFHRLLTTGATPARGTQEVEGGSSSLEEPEYRPWSGPVGG